MRNLWMLCAPALLAGCAATPQQIAERARTVSDLELCEGYYTAPGQYTGVLAAEVSRRGLNCRQYESDIASRQQMRAAQAQANAAQAQANAAKMAAAAQILRSMQPAPMPMPQTMSCNSYRMGNSVQTDCR